MENNSLATVSTMHTHGNVVYSVLNSFELKLFRKSVSRELESEEKKATRQSIRLNVYLVLVLVYTNLCHAELLSNSIKKCVN